jgi:hypothetical protein
LIIIEILKTNSPQATIDKSVQRQFLQRLNVCFGYFATIPKYYDQAVQLFSDIIYNPKMAIRTTVTTIANKPDSLDFLLKELSRLTKGDTIKWHQVQEIIGKYHSRGVPFSSILTALERVFENYQGQDLKSVFSRFSEILWIV